jgi:hypothetical protein
MKDVLFGAKQYEALTTLTSVVALTAARYGLNTFAETITNGAIGAGGSWTAAGDFAIAANAATYTHNTGTGSLTQAIGALAIAPRSSRPYILQYTVSGPSGTAPTLVIPATFASVATPLTNLDIAGIYSLAFTSAVTPGAFAISGTSAGAGAVTLDDLSLIEQPVDSERMHARRAIVSVETAAIRACWDGTIPTVTAAQGAGILLNPGDILELETPREIDYFRAINAVAGNGATIRVVYEF